MTKDEFRFRWNKDDCDITFDEVAECAKEWGLLEYDGKKIHRVKMATKVESSTTMEMLHITSVISRILKPQTFNFREKTEIKLI